MIAFAKSPLKYLGAKQRLAPIIISHMPEHHSYVEPYFGSGAVLFNKNKSPIETVNDLDSDVVNLFEVIRNDVKPLIHAVDRTPFSREEYENSYNQGETLEPVEKARRFLVRSWQGHGFRSNGTMVGWKNDVQGREAAYAVRNWNRVPGWIESAAVRLKEVQIENRPAIEVIERFNYSNVLLYCDPPYVLSTRSGKNYKYEMSDHDHIKLINILKSHKAKIILSGYDNNLYTELLRGWDKIEVNANAEYGRKRTECLWLNFEHQERFW